jgi:hypothetical protein
VFRDLFRGDNINDLVQGEEVQVGISLHDLVTKKGGTERVIAALGSDIRVSHSPHLVTLRPMQSLQLLPVSRLNSPSTSDKL